MALEVHNRTGFDALRRSSQSESRLIFLTVFMMFLVATFVMRLAPWHWGDIRRNSIFGEARASTDRLMPFLFMG